MRICKECGRERGFLHMQICMIYQTNQAIDRYNEIVASDKALADQLKEWITNSDYYKKRGVTWTDDVYPYTALRKYGMDHIGTMYCKGLLKKYDNSTEPLDRAAIIYSLLGVFFVFEISSQINVAAAEHSLVNDLCQVCKLDPTGCENKCAKQSSEIKIAVLTTFNLPKEVQDKISKNDIVMTHVGIMLLWVAFTIFDEVGNKILAQNFFDLYKIFLEIHELNNMMTETDRLVGF